MSWPGSEAMRGRIWRVRLIAVLGGWVLGIVNGVVRELVYKDDDGDLTAWFLLISGANQDLRPKPQRDMRWLQGVAHNPYHLTCQAIEVDLFTHLA
jgi:hypothetical protein